MKNKLQLAITILMVIGLAIGIFALAYLIKNQDNLSLKVDTFESTLSKLNPINGKDATDEQILNGIALYCKQHNDCTGKDGKSPIKGIDYNDGMSIKGDKGDSIKGDKGDSIKGDAGADSTVPGSAGTPGPGTERRCVVVSPSSRRIEWRNEGDDGWQLEYYLSPGQLCPQEV